MEKGKFKKPIIIAALVLAVILISITYLFAINNYSLMGNIWDTIVDIFMPFIIGVVIAYLLKGTCNFFERTVLRILSKTKLSPKAKNRIATFISIFFTYVVWAAALIVLMAITMFYVVESISQFYSDLQSTYIDGIARWILDLARNNEFIANILGGENITALDELIDVSEGDKIPKVIEILSANGITTDSLTQLLPSETDGLGGIFGGIFNGTVSFMSTMINTVIGIVISVFLLINRKTLAAKSVLFLHCVFKKDQIVNAVVDEAKFADKMFSGFIEGKIIGSTIVGLVYYIVLEIMGVPYAPLIAVLCGVTNIVPIFGPFIGAIPSAVIILAADYTKVIPFLLFVWVYQMIDGYIVDPHIVGGNIKLPSIWVIFAVMLFGGLFGFPGLLIGVPLFAVIYDIVGKICAYLLKKNGKYDLLVQFKKQQEAGSKKKKRSKKAAAPAVADGVDVDEIAEDYTDEITNETENPEEINVTSENE